METYFMSGRSSSPILRFRLLPPKLFLRSPQVLPLVLQDFSCNLQARSQEERSEARNRMFILGMGFVGQFFADQLKKDGWEVIGTCTSDAKMKKLEGMGFDVHLFDSNDPEPGLSNCENLKGPSPKAQVQYSRNSSNQDFIQLLNYQGTVVLVLRSLHTMESASHLLISIPSVAGLGDPVLHQHKDLLQSRLSHGNLQWLCYLSSTSVYGDSGGAWVDEDYPTNPTSESAKARVDAERGWLKLGHDLGISAQVFRLGGIYGPGRSALDTILRQESLSKGQKMREARRYTSRVHIADICQALKASINMPTFGRIYNIVDDDPAPRLEVFAFAQALIEKRCPTWMKQGPAHEVKNVPAKKKVTTEKKTIGGEKRVSNARLKDELGVRLLYPSYRSGLPSIMDYMEENSFPNFT